MTHPDLVEAAAKAIARAAATESHGCWCDVCSTLAAVTVLAAVTPMIEQPWKTLIEQHHNAMCASVSWMKRDCDCWVGEALGWVTRPTDYCGHCRNCIPNYQFMMVCETCGNKRCPHANDHDNACTHSNDSGQEGSAYNFKEVTP
jgi:hypothetical protein